MRMKERTRRGRPPTLHAQSRSVGQVVVVTNEVNH